LPLAERLGIDCSASLAHSVTYNVNLRNPGRATKFQMRNKDVIIFHATTVQIAKALLYCCAMINDPIVAAEHAITLNNLIQAVAPDRSG
jgi:hypothetical protein